MKKLGLNLTKREIKAGPQRREQSDPVPDPFSDVDYEAGIEASSQQ